MKHWKSWFVLAWVATVVLTLAAYLPALSAGFYFDDVPNIVEAPAIHWQQVSWESLKATALSAWLPRRFVANVSFAVDHAIWKLEPAPYHVTNVILHLLTGLALGWVCFLYALQDPPRPIDSRTAAWAALCGVALFLAHPLNTQAVTYVVQRMSVLAALFGLLSFACYLMARRARTPAGATTAAVSAAIAWLLALGSKENAVLVPAVILLYDLCFFRDRWRWSRGSRGNRARVRWLGVMAGAAVLAVAAAFLWAYTGGIRVSLTETLPGRDFTGLERILSQARVHWFYLSLLTWPLPGRLNLDHDFPVSRSLVDPPSTLLAVLALAGLLTTVAILLWKRPRYGFPVAAYFVLHAVESAPISLELVFEHRMYLPMASLCLLVAVTITDTHPGKRLGLAAVVVLLVSALGTMTRGRNQTWSDELEFHYDCARKSPHKFRPQFNLGTKLGKRGRYLEAVGYLRRAVELRPDRSEAHNQLATAYAKLGRLVSAIEHYREAVRLEPRNAEAQYNLAWLLDGAGQREEARELYRRFLELAPPRLTEARRHAALRLRQLGEGG